MKTFQKFYDSLLEASGNSKRPADRSDVGDKEPDSIHNEWGKKVLRHHGRQEHASDSELPDNFEVKAPKPKRPVGFGAPQGDKLMPEGYDPDQDDEYNDSRDRRPSVMLKKPMPLTPSQRAAKDRLNHKFSDDIGGSSSNYKPPYFRKEEYDFIEEGWTAGRYELRDGSAVKLSSQDASVLNSMFERSTSQNSNSLKSTMMKNIREFRSVLEFARSLNEEDSLNMDHSDLTCNRCGEDITDCECPPQDGEEV